MAYDRYALDDWWDNYLIKDVRHKLDAGAVQLLVACPRNARELLKYYEALELEGTYRDVLDYRGSRLKEFMARERPYRLRFKTYGITVGDMIFESIFILEPRRGKGALQWNLHSRAWAFSETEIHPSPKLSTEATVGHDVVLIKGHKELDALMKGFNKEDAVCELVISPDPNNPEHWDALFMPHPLAKHPMDPS